MGISLYSEVYNLSRIVLENKDKELAVILLKKIDELRAQVSTVLQPESVSIPWADE